jgi:hypothetical protein
VLDQSPVTGSQGRGSREAGPVIADDTSLLPRLPRLDFLGRPCWAILSRMRVLKLTRLSTP